MRNFYPRSPCGERRGAVEGQPYQPAISIHALLAESDPHRRRCGISGPNFYPRSPCGERQLPTVPQGPKSPISIHALLAESDCGWTRRRKWAQISIHALLAESDGKTVGLIGQLALFLSTLSLRRATIMRRWTAAKRPPNFYPRSPCGERLICGRSATTCARFLSTLSLRRATINRGPYHVKRHISIHALLAESDPYRPPPLTSRAISIHALLAESDGLFMLYDTSALIFLSTLSLRRAT